MKNNIKTIMAALLVSGFVGGSAFAATTADQNIAFTIDAFNSITASGDPAPLGTVSHATDAATTYSVSTNGTNMSITAEIEENMPTGVTLNVALVHPTGTSVSVAHDLSTAPFAVVTGITELSQAALGITYNLSALVTVPPTASDSRVVTLTITQGS